jgi:hypothetical protein
LQQVLSQQHRRRSLCFLHNRFQSKKKRPLANQTPIFRFQVFRYFRPLRGEQVANAMLLSMSSVLSLPALMCKCNLRFVQFYFQIRSRFQVDNVVYDVMLNQTVRCAHPLPSALAYVSTGHFQQQQQVRCMQHLLMMLSLVTSTRYYLIQLLQDDQNPELFYVFKRWGRVGYCGGASRQSAEQYDSAEQGAPLWCMFVLIVFCCFSPASTAIEAFCHSFESKTNNEWQGICRGDGFVRFSAHVCNAVCQCAKTSLPIGQILFCNARTPFFLGDLH